MAFEATRLAIPDVILVRPQRFTDTRGLMMEVYRQAEFRIFGIDTVFVQDNEAHTSRRGTPRGLHYQEPPHAQAKLIRVLKGAVFDVAVDLRQESKTFGKVLGTVLSAKAGEQLFVPRGFAHGYTTLEDDTVVTYKCDAYYAPAAEGGIQFDDPALGIHWPEAPLLDLMSEKDRKLPCFGELATPFRE